MRTLIDAMRAWLRESTPRWVTIVMVVWIMAVSALYGTAVMGRQDSIEADQDRLRSLAFCEVYFALDELYDVADPEHENPQANQLRESLAARFRTLNRIEAIDLEVCE